MLGVGHLRERQVHAAGAADVAPTLINTVDVAPTLINVTDVAPGSNTRWFNQAQAKLGLHGIHGGYRIVTGCLALRVTPVSANTQLMAVAS
jgi:hypothetical protein